MKKQILNILVFLLNVIVKKDNIRNSYQHLSSVLSMGNIEFFTLTVLLGKCVVKERKSVEWGVEQFFKLTKNNT